MKRHRLIWSIIISLLILAGCEDLDREFITTLTEKQVTNSFTYTSYMVASVYAYLPSGLLAINGAMMASATDEAEHTLETSAVQKFNTGDWNAVSNPDDVWGRYYQGIRRANLVLQSADSVNLDLYKLDPDQQETYQLRLDEIKRWKYEVRFLRAYFHFELVKRYGGIPIITDVLPLDYDFGSIKRNSLADCIKFISDECDAAAGELPVTYSASELGRATKGAALALKSRALLYAASDLYNDPSWAGGYAQAELISLPGGDRQARWKAAADAARKVIDLKAYTIGSNYKDLFGVSNYTNPEVILIRRDGASNNFEQASYPIGYDLGQSGTTPSQNLVDAYEMVDGSAFDWNNPEQAAFPYSNRDPRLAMSIITNNSSFKGRPVECWTGGRDGKGIARATRTGYYLKKYVNENLDLLQGRTSVHSWILFRLAEIYLNYAEALNEYDPGNSDIKLYVDAVRARSGVGMPALPPGLSQIEMREKIRNERRVELAFEDHRFWDVRRWMLAASAQGAPLYGVEITNTGDGTVTSFDYKKISVENRVFEPKMNFYPVPQNEVSIGLVQNPLW